jgi:hypothetical protein
VCVNLRIAALFSGIPGKILGYPHAFNSNMVSFIIPMGRHALLSLPLSDSQHGAVGPTHQAGPVDTAAAFSERASENPS